MRKNLTDSIFKITHGDDESHNTELIVEDRINSVVIDVLDSSRNVKGFKLTVEKVQ